MKNFLKLAPLPLRRKLLLTGILGILCLLIGLAMFLYARDRISLLLSALVCGLSLYKAWSIYRIVKKKEYEVVEGTCIGIVPKPFRKYRKVKIMDDEGIETTLLLSNQSKIKIGFRYRFYFGKTQRLTLGNKYFDAALSSDCYLGHEELGEFGQAPPKKSD